MPLSRERVRRLGLLSAIGGNRSASVERPIGFEGGDFVIAFTSLLRRADAEWTETGVGWSEKNKRSCREIVEAEASPRATAWIKTDRENGGSNA